MNFEHESAAIKALVEEAQSLTDSSQLRLDESISLRTQADEKLAEARRRLDRLNATFMTAGSA